MSDASTNGISETSGESEGGPIALSYFDTYSDTVLLLVHGFPLDGRMWSPQLDELAVVARVIAPDLRGFGESEVAPAPYSIEEMAGDCLDLVDALGVERFVLGGLSMGGYVALEILRQAPDRVQGLILASTRAGADGEEARAGRDAAAATVREKGTGPLVAGMLDKLLAEATYEEEPELVDFVKEIMDDADPEGVVGALAAMRDRPDATARLADIQVPTLVLHGDEDRVIPPAEAEATHAAIPDAKLAIIEGAGHLPNLERFETFNELVAAFLSEL